MYDVPRPKSSLTDLEGDSDRNQIILKDINQHNFEALLHMFASRSGSCMYWNASAGTPYLTVDQLSGVLRLAKMWLMKDIHNAAKGYLLHGELGASETVRKIKLAREHCISDLLKETCRDIIEREAPSYHGDGDPSYHGDGDLCCWGQGCCEFDRCAGASGKVQWEEVGRSTVGSWRWLKRVSVFRDSRWSSSRGRGDLRSRD
ncbi:hypothetical protein BDV98DRAFT_576139 [Pterulicium gracile]|uniref:BTB domain-containing protein n=1 Tax=Pterulicium gracile TaxID=1884261 RepID=A0A5C3Q607_9AGAR|nr:hypothetical protein BDV98DRAFT_576139 [Pterula gracilis]